MTEHHAKELEGEKMVICQSCHTIIEQYREAIENIQKRRQAGPQTIAVWMSRK